MFASALCGERSGRGAERRRAFDDVFSYREPATSYAHDILQWQRSIAGGSDRPEPDRGSICRLATLTIIQNENDSAHEVEDKHGIAVSCSELSTSSRCYGDELLCTGTKDHRGGIDACTGLKLP